MPVPELTREQVAGLVSKLPQDEQRKLLAPIRRARPRPAERSETTGRGRPRGSFAASAVSTGMPWMTAPASASSMTWSTRTAVALRCGS